MKERKLFFERGANLKDFLKPEKKFRFPWLKVAVLMIGIGVGFGIDGVLIESESRILRNPGVVFAIMAICIGISMIIANFINKGKSGS